MSKKYFAAVNSAHGFVSYFEETFFCDKITRRYLIKGGAGTGKSTLMKTVAQAAESSGHDVELYYCSSDVRSLDGVIIRDIGACIIDATAPHAYDCKYVGCVDTLVDAGRFLNGEKLYGKTDEIKELSEKSSNFYKSGYKCLRSAGELALELYESGKRHLDERKTQRLVARIVRPTAGKERSIDIRIASAHSALGITVLSQSDIKPTKAYYIEDKYVSAPILINELSHRAGGRITLFKDALLPDRFEAIYLEESGVLVSAQKGLLPEKFIKISTGELYDGYYKQNREKLRFEAKLISALIDMGCESFKSAKESHDELERINISAMDFRAMTEYTEKLTEEILSYRRAL